MSAGGFSVEGLMTGAVFDYDQSVQGAGGVSRPPLQPMWGEDG